MIQHLLHVPPAVLLAGANQLVLDDAEAAHERRCHDAGPLALLPREELLDSHLLVVVALDAAIAVRVEGGLVLVHDEDWQLLHPVHDAQDDAQKQLLLCCKVLALDVAQQD